MIAHIPLEPLVLIGGVLGLTTFGLGALVGSRRLELKRRVEALEVSLELARKERENALAELAAAKERIAELHREREAYRNQVAEHFAGTSDQLRGLTLQYRSLFEHLADGAGTLCPERFPGLEGGFEAAVRRIEEGDSEPDDESSAESA